MKYILFLLLGLLLNFNSYSQTNRYSKVSTSTQSSSNLSPNSYEYYEAIANNSSNYIESSSYRLKSRVIKILVSTNDVELINDLQVVNSYLNPLFSDERISIATAEWYLKKSRQKFNKARRRYNRRIKKAQKK